MVILFQVFTAEAQAMGADVSDLNSLGNMVSSDTANICRS